MTKRNSYTKEFKLEAVRLLESGDKPVTEIARELGIRRNEQLGKLGTYMTTLRTASKFHIAFSPFK